MKKHLHTLALAAALFLCLPRQPVAQVLALDSLERLSASPIDSVRIDALTYLGRRLRGTDPDRALALAIQARDAAQAAGDLARQAKATNDVGIGYAVKENYAEALSYFRQAFQLHSQRGNAAGMANGHSNIAGVYKHLGDYVASKATYMKALHLSDSLGDLPGRGATLYNLGVVTHMASDAQEALTLFEEALTIWEVEKNDAERAMVLHGMALIYIEKKQYAQALKLLFEDLRIQRAQNNKVNEATTLNSIGMAYVKQGNYEAGINYLLQSQQRCIETGRKEPLAQTFYNLADIHLRQNQPQKAIPLLQQQLAIGAEMNHLLTQKQGHALMAQAQADLGDYRQAYEHLKMAELLKDSTFGQDKARSLQQWQARLEVYEKDRLISEQQQEMDWLEARANAERQRLWMALAALALAGLSALLLYQKYRLRQQANRELEQKNQLIATQKADIEAANQELERRMLRAQINPHFIFNALGSIQHFITANDRAAALKYLSKFSTLLRQVLQDSVSGHVTLAEDVKLLGIYLELEALRFDTGFEYSISVAPELDAHNAEVPVLLVQPFVENAILHGLMPKAGHRKLTITFTGEAEAIVCRVVDNGIGRAAAQQLKAKKTGSQPSHGLEVSKRRLHAMDKGRGLKAALAINDLLLPDGSAAGTEAVITIPKI